jgi:hypothetical protein
VIFEVLMILVIFEVLMILVIFEVLVIYLGNVPLLLIDVETFIL